jgi:predicted transcriptional regulator of viral defense system
MAQHLPFSAAPVTTRRTYLAEAVIEQLQEQRLAVVSSYTLFQTLRALIREENRQQLYLRSGSHPVPYLNRVITNLLDTGGLFKDTDYRRGVYRIPLVGEASAEEVCALVNPFGYVSHLSAMQRWGLTDRRPEALHLTMPSPAIARILAEERMALDYGRRFEEMPRDDAVKLALIEHPDRVRGRSLATIHTKHLGQWVEVRDGHVRLATVGQTFLDMLEAPQQCGGMAHVLDVWREHASMFLTDIVSAIDQHGSPIAKVRGGYLLDEMLALDNDLRVQGWQRYAQRGSSRVLDPTKGFNPTHSAKWMLSINV